MHSIECLSGQGFCRMPRDSIECLIVGGLRYCYEMYYTEEEPPQIPPNNQHSMQCTVCLCRNPARDLTLIKMERPLEYHYLCSKLVGNTVNRQW